MRQLLLAAGALCASVMLPHQALAQNQTVMPGQAVGTGFKFNSIGLPFPQSGTKIGQPTNIPDDSPLMRRADPNNPFDGFRGTALDPSAVVAPIPGVGNAFENFIDKMKAAVGLSVKPPHRDPTTSPPASSAAIANEPSR